MSIDYKSIDYKGSGVDIEAGEALVSWIKSNQPQKWPHQDRLVSGVGGFAALFRADFPKMKEPCLVSCTDGVGTKLKLASYFGRYSEVAQDLVAMCVNDLICVGAQPLFFLDYYATGKLDLEAAKEFIAGVQKACIESDCALIGGETAEMPGVYQKGDFDCAGFAVGVVDRAHALGAHKVQVGDQILGVPSSGFHSNGFSLLRKVFESDLESYADRLMTPTQLYVQFLKELFPLEGLHAVANITGGGMDNIPRVLNPGQVARLQPWAVPGIFLEVHKRAQCGWGSLLQTLNCGVGMAIILDVQAVKAVQEKAKQHNLKVWHLGEVGKATDLEQKTWDLDLQAMAKLNGTGI